MFDKSLNNVKQLKRLKKLKKIDEIERKIDEMFSLNKLLDFKLIVFSISDQKFELDSIFLTCLDHKLVVLSLVLHNFMKSISKSIF